jgi:hypothetical protein
MVNPDLHHGLLATALKFGGRLVSFWSLLPVHLCWSSVSLISLREMGKHFYSADLLGSFLELAWGLSIIDVQFSGFREGTQSFSHHFE